MPDETRPESQDLQDYEVQDASDTLDGNPGDDPLDRGVIPPERWSSAIKFGSTAGVAGRWIALAPHDALPAPGCLPALLEAADARPR